MNFLKLFLIFLIGLALVFKITLFASNPSNRSNRSNRSNPSSLHLSVMDFSTAAVPVSNLHSHSFSEDLTLGAVDPTSQSTILGYQVMPGPGDGPWDYMPVLVFFIQSSSCENNPKTQGQLVNPSAYNAPRAPGSLVLSQTDVPVYVTGSSIYNLGKNYLNFGQLPDLSKIQCVKVYDGFRSVAGNAVPVVCDSSTQTCVRTTTGSADVFTMYAQEIN